MSFETRACQNCKNSFQIDPEDFNFYEKMKVPPPTLCPECRFQRRLFFMNERALYKANCGLCGKSMISMFPPDTKYLVYCPSCWWSDAWDGRDYGTDYDPTRPFLVQLKELNEKVPQQGLAVNQPTLVNSEYINHAATSKNCYLIYTADECENVLYSEIMLRNKDSMDGTMFGRSELCYGLIVSGDCYRVFFSEDCENCSEVYFSKDCVGCSDCVGCFGLRSKKYHIFNQPYSKEEYMEKFKEMRLDTHSGLGRVRAQAERFWKTRPHKFAHALRNADVTGDYVYETKNSKDMFDVVGPAEDSRFCQIMTMGSVRDAYDYTIWGNNAQRIYEGMIVGEGADTVKFCVQAWPNVFEVEYSEFTIGCSHVFGCAGLNKKQYCILNREYTREEYDKLRARIIADMDNNPYVDAQGRVYKYGEFFPFELGMFAYNESYAMDFFPLTKEEAIARGFRWREPDQSPYVATKKSGELPDSIRDVEDDILKEVIECAGCLRAFRIIPAELQLLRRFDLPLPRKCPNCRHFERMARLNPPRLWKRNCAKCGMDMETSYAPDRPEIIYCEQCYQAEVA